MPPGQRARKQFVFEAAQPLRYLACVISRFTRVTTRDLLIGAENDPVGAKPVKLTVQANPRQAARARAFADRAAAIYEYYGRLIGDAPYPAFTLAVTENDLPGGHSPAYFAILNQPLPLSPIVWRNDPVAFDGYPPFFLAHEIAHQWWGQAVGWKNYHEQWISEGFAQYFAALYAAQDRGDEVFRGMLRQMRRWAIEQSSQGPVYLGYRLGHIKAEGRVFRAIVYNKGAMVLHMLRRLVGDEKFFAGLRQFYATWKFRKAGTDDFRLAMQKASGTDLTAFFDGWVYGASVPVLAFTSTVSGSEARIRFEHRGAVMPTPVTVTITYADGTSEEVVVAVTERVGRADHRAQGSGALDRGQPRLLGASPRSKRLSLSASSAGPPVPPIDSGQINRRDARFAVALERLEHQDEARTAVLVETGQALAERAAIDFLPAALGGTAETGGDGRRGRADADLLAVEERQDGNRHGARAEPTGASEATSGRGRRRCGRNPRGPLQLAHDERGDGDGGTEEGCRDHPFDDRRNAQTTRRLRVAAIRPPLLG